MAYSHIGKNFTPPDLQAKVTGKARYVEDFRMDGMLFCRLLVSPMPHARVRNIDISAAMQMPGVAAILSADDVPGLIGKQHKKTGGSGLGIFEASLSEAVSQNPAKQPVLSNEPRFVGQAILAVAAESETIAHDAIDKIKLDLEPLPYTVDPLESLYPGGPDASENYNVVKSDFGRPPEPLQIKWTARDFAAAGDDKLPMGEATHTWTYGDIEAGFAGAHLVLEESFVTNSNPHHSLESRSCMAYWQNGKCFVHGSTQSQSFVKPALASILGIDTRDVVYIGEFCGGGFGSKIVSYPLLSLAPLMAKKTGRPVLLRVSRAEEFYNGSARPGFQGRIKMGFARDGRVTAADLYIVLENGPYEGSGEHGSAAEAVSLLYQTPAMRYRAIGVSTNTTPKGAQRGPGQNQIAEAMEPFLSKAARELGIDQVEIRKINAAHSKSTYGPSQAILTSAFQREALEKGAAKFNWDEKKKQSGVKKGSRIIGVGIGQAWHSAGGSGLDGLVRITPDGMLHIHTGVGNPGTFSYVGTSRAAAEVLKCNWDHCVIERGDSRTGLPWNSPQGGSNTTFTETRTNYVAAMDAVNKLKEIAAMDLGGKADDYDIGDEKVIAKTDPSRAMTYAAAAQRAVELGGRFSGREVPDDIHAETKEAVGIIAGTGLVGVAKDTLERTGTPPAICVGFMRIELDTETGKYEILDYVGVSDCGTVIHPMGLETQIKGGAVHGIGMASLEKTVYDPQNGLPANVGLYQCKPPSYLDIPLHMDWDAVNIADPQNPVGARGTGEPVMGCAAAALLCAISDALHGQMFNRAPVTADMILNALNGQEHLYKPLRINSQ